MISFFASSDITTKKHNITVEQITEIIDCLMFLNKGTVIIYFYESSEKLERNN